MRASAVVTHELRLSGLPEVFGIYVLGPWGPIPPAPEKIRPGNWMHKQHSPSRRVVIAPGEPLTVELRLADYFPVDAPLVFRPGRYQVNVKFYRAGLAGLERPLDSGLLTFTLPDADPPSERE